MRLRASLGNSRSFTLEKADRSYISRTIKPGSVGPFSKLAFKAVLAAQPGKITCPRPGNDKPWFRIYWAYIRGKESNMATARVFKSGNSQAVRLPKEFRVKSKELEIFRRGDELVLKEKAVGMERVLDILANLPDDFDLGDRKKDKPQKRKGL